MSFGVDAPKAVHYIDGNGDLHESLPDENGKFDEETEFWRDSQWSSGWLGCAYRAYPKIEAKLKAAPSSEKNDGQGEAHPGREHDGLGEAAKASSDALSAEPRTRSRSRERIAK